MGCVEYLRDRVGEVGWGNRKAKLIASQWLCNLGMAEGERKRWSELMTPKGERGLILKSIKVDFKFVCASIPSSLLPQDSYHTANINQTLASP